MRGPFKIGLVGLALLTLVAAFGRAAVSAALDRPAPPLIAVQDHPIAEHAEFGPPPAAMELTAAVETSAAEFGPPPQIVLAEGPDPFGSLPFSATPPDAFGFNPPQSEQAQPALDKKARLAALAAEVSTLASDAEIDRLIGELETTVAEKRAEAELRDARAALERVVDTFPQTVAADAARDMLGRTAKQACEIVPVEAPR